VPRAAFVDAARLVLGALQRLDAPERLTVSAAALKYRALENAGGGYSGPWTFETAPYLRRPMDCLGVESPYQTVAVMGPAQCGKSDIGNNWLLHTAICDPADMLTLFPDKQVGHDYVQQQIEKMIRLSPELAARQLAHQGADNIHSKQFSGCTAFFVWPVASQLRARPIPRIRIDDYDAVPEDIGGEGNALTLAEGRQTAFEGWAKTYVNSSPSLGETRGIEGLVASGTDERWHVPCKACGEFFALAFERLKFAEGSTAEAAAASAAVVCPHCGGVHEQADKPALMAAGAWLGAGQAIARDGTVAGEAKPSPIASFRIDGLMGFASWAKLAYERRAAELVFERTQDEEALRAFWNTRAGHNYRAQTEMSRIDPDQLADRGEAWRLGTVPQGVAFLTAAVDIQAKSFEVLVKGWNDRAESWLIDRFSIRQLADGRTDVRPATHPEHWHVLLHRAIRARYPVADGSGREMAVATTAIDMHGLDGVTENARAFWRHARRSGVGDLQITLVRGSNVKAAPMLPKPSWETDDKGRKKPGSAKFFTIGVNNLKNMLANRLAREDEGPGFIHFPADAPEAYFAELAGEERVEGEWTRIGANESFDLEVYAIAAYLRLRPERIDWTRPPWWAVAKIPGAKPAPPPAPERPPPFVAAGNPPPPRPARPRRGGFVHNW
jgi:phage terminase large subunit GpA-like protein